MGLMRWFERKLFTGDVLHDFGVLQERSSGISRLRTSVLLCRRSGVLQIVFRQAGTAPLAASVQYVPIDVSAETLARLQTALDEARRVLSAAPGTEGRPS